VRELVSEYLTADGHTVATAENGEEALEKFVADRFALVVTDKVMPELGGEGLVVRLRELAPQVPVILLTAMGQAMQARRQRPFGVSQIVNKPIIRDELRRAIANVFQMTECPASAGSDRPVLATTVG
jgi:DNA-binding NtrC family response regulator